jgi:hypothetical protein
LLAILCVCEKEETAPVARDDVARGLKSISFLAEFIFLFFFPGRKSFGMDDRFCVRSRNGGSVWLRFFIRDGT